MSHPLSHNISRVINKIQAVTWDRMAIELGRLHFIQRENYHLTPTTMPDYFLEIKIVLRNNGIHAYMYLYNIFKT